MTTAAWPTALPQLPLAKGYQGRPSPNVARFQPDVGEPISRLRFTGRSREETVSLPPLTRDQLAILLDFHDHDCAQGAYPFWLPSPHDGMPRRSWFMEPPAVSHLDTVTESGVTQDLYSVQLSLRVKI